MKSKPSTNVILLALLVATSTMSSACTLFFGSAHHDEARCVQRCRALRWQVAAIAYHGEFASSCVCQPPSSSSTSSSSSSSSVTPAQTSSSTTGAAIAAAARPVWRNWPVILPKRKNAAVSYFRNQTRHGVVFSSPRSQPTP